MKITAGVDEVGRGSLIGPVFAAAVILKKSINTKLLKDSKLLSKKKREYLYYYIKKNSIWSLGKASVTEIETINRLPVSSNSYQSEVPAFNIVSVPFSSCL